MSPYFAMVGVGFHVMPFFVNLNPEIARIITAKVEKSLTSGKGNRGSLCLPLGFLFCFAISFLTSDGVYSDNRVLHSETTSSATLL